MIQNDRQNGQNDQNHANFSSFFDQLAQIKPRPETTIPLNPFESYNTAYLEYYLKSLRGDVDYYDDKPAYLGDGDKSNPSKATTTPTSNNLPSQPLQLQSQFLPQETSPYHNDTILATYVGSILTTSSAYSTYTQDTTIYRPPGAHWDSLKHYTEYSGNLFGSVSHPYDDHEAWVRMLVQPYCIAAQPIVATVKTNGPGYATIKERKEKEQQQTQQQQNATTSQSSQQQSPSSQPQQRRTDPTPRSYKPPTPLPELEVDNGAKHSLLRPETVESLFYLWRTTKHQFYREALWSIFLQMVYYARVHSGGYTNLSTVTWTGFGEDQKNGKGVQGQRQPQQSSSSASSQTPSTTTSTPTPTTPTALKYSHDNFDWASYHGLSITHDDLITQFESANILDPGFGPTTPPKTTFPFGPPTQPSSPTPSSSNSTPNFVSKRIFGGAGLQYGSGSSKHMTQVYWNYDDNAFTGKVRHINSTADIGGDIGDGSQAGEDEPQLLSLSQWSTNLNHALSPKFPTSPSTSTNPNNSNYDQPKAKSKPLMIDGIPKMNNKLESFTIAETLFYIYLAFTDGEEGEFIGAGVNGKGLFDFDDWVFNTEAQPLPIWK